MATDLESGLAGGLALLIAIAAIMITACVCLELFYVPGLRVLTRPLAQMQLRSVRRR